MKGLYNTYNFIFNCKWILYLVVLLVFLVFHIPIELIITNTIVKFALKYVESTFYNDFIFFLLVFSIIVFMLKKRNDYIPSTNTFFIFLTSSLIYSYYRFCSNYWIFTSLSFCKQIKYLDLQLLVFIVNLCLIRKSLNELFVGKEESKDNNRDSFINDESLGVNESESYCDLLGYGPYAELLANKIISSRFQNSFAIGINAQWGMGKTSFIDLIKRKIKQIDNLNCGIIEVDFSPWSSHSPKAIIQDFFQILQDKISPFHSTLSRQLINYSNKLVAMNGNSLSQFIHTSLTTFAGIETLQQKFVEINKALKQINKKIIIYIDDMDRLDKDEVIEVIRLLRNTANFYNCFFIVAYDRNYVVNAIKGMNSHKPEEFLEKIFQLEITLPHFKKDILSRKLGEYLIDNLDKKYHDIINKYLILNKSQNAAYLDDWLETMRDVIRLANAMVLNFNRLHGEVYFHDFLRLELLRGKYPAVYELLFRKRDDFLDNVSGNNFRNYFKLKKNKGIYALHEFLEKNYSVFSVPEKDLKKITLLIDNIFNSDGDYTIEDDKRLSVIFPSKFDRYFAYNLFEDSLSELEFSKARATMGVDKFKQEISRWVSERKELDLKKKFEDINYFDDINDFELIIEGIFHLAVQQSIFSNYSSVWYNQRDLVEKLINQIFVNYNNEKKKDFILTLLKRAPKPYIFESDFIYNNDRLLKNKLRFTVEELKELKFIYFKNYCSHTTKIDSNLWRLFGNCKIRSNTYYSGRDGLNHNESQSEESKTLFIQFILEKDLDGFILKQISRSEDVEGRRNYTLCNLGEVLFGSWSNYKTKLQTQNATKWSYLGEFLAFFNQCEESNFQNSIEFTFNSIPIDQLNRN